MRRKERKISAYMTVEASMVVPYAFVLVILSILMAFYLYNHCIVYQSCYIAALRGQQIKEVSDSVIQNYSKAELDKLLNEQIYSYSVNGRVSVNAVTISATADSGFRNRLSNFGLYRETLMTIDRKATVNRYNPAEFIRKARLFSR